MTSSDINDRLSEADRKRFRELYDEYMKEAHAVQAGIAMRLSIDATFATQKDIRTGLDTSKADMGGLVNLLVAKGIFTDVEYMEAIVASMRQEKERWEEDISARVGNKVTLV